MSQDEWVAFLMHYGIFEQCYYVTLRDATTVFALSAAQQDADSDHSTIPYATFRDSALVTLAGICFNEWGVGVGATRAMLDALLAQVSEAFGDYNEASAEADWGAITAAPGEGDWQPEGGIVFSNEGETWTGDGWQAAGGTSGGTRSERAVRHTGACEFMSGL